MSKDEIIDSLDFIGQSIHLIRERFSIIKGPDDFVITPEGITLLDAIVMRWINEKNQLESDEIEAYVKSIFISSIEQKTSYSYRDTSPKAGDHTLLPSSTQSTAAKYKIARIVLSR